MGVSITYFPHASALGFGCVEVAHLTLNYTGTPPMAPCQALSESPGGAEYMQETGTGRFQVGSRLLEFFFFGGGGCLL